MSNTTSTPKQVTSRDNKGRFVKGHTGNPKGRPTKGNTIGDVIRSMMGTKNYRKEDLFDTLWSMATDNKDIQAIKTIIQYHDGNPNQPISGKIEHEHKPIFGGNVSKYHD